MAHGGFCLLQPFEQWAAGRNPLHGRVYADFTGFEQETLRQTPDVVAIPRRWCPCCARSSMSCIIVYRARSWSAASTPAATSS